MPDLEPANAEKLAGAVGDRSRDDDNLAVIIAGDVQRHRDIIDAGIERV